MIPKMILFDLGVTLVPFRHDRLKQSQAPGIYAFFFDKTNGVSRNQRLDRGELELEEAYKDYLAIHPSISFAQFSEIWRSIFDEPSEKAFECVLKVRERGFRVGICSNTNRYHWLHVLQRRPEYGEPWVQAFLSYKMKSVKTDEGFFQRIARETGLETGDLMLIDDLEENILAARRNGLTALHVVKPVEFQDLLGLLHGV